MKNIDIAELTALAPFIQPGSTEPVLVKSHGRTVAAVVPVASADDVEDLTLAHNPQMEAILQRSQQRLEQEGGLTSDEVRRRLGLSAP